MHSTFPLLSFLLLSVFFHQLQAESSTPKDELVVKILKKGRNCEEKKAEPGDHLKLHYVGRVDNEDGKIFDSSKERGHLYKFQLGAHEVIQGYEEGIPGMCEGEIRTLRIPPSMAYGGYGVPSVGIPPNSYLHFTVELKKIVKGELKPEHHRPSDEL
ncbi:uncharacterized protein [Lepeophtheirus salmonis]|uniref:peptidylprolyl isomerase n=1 Tax=Lepeophtheirus salmonis TaxID=72036 RepID=A0A0K2TJ47_LEPSM|nr:FK506-binding protein 2-like [Lepeophtheirus salmonis]